MAGGLVEGFDVHEDWRGVGARERLRRERKREVRAVLAARKRQRRAKWAARGACPWRRWTSLRSSARGAPSFYRFAFRYTRLSIPPSFAPRPPRLSLLDTHPLSLSPIKAVMTVKREENKKELWLKTTRVFLSSELLMAKNAQKSMKEAH